MAIEQAVDEMQVAGPAPAGTDRELAGQMSFGAGREGCYLLVAHKRIHGSGLGSTEAGLIPEAPAVDETGGAERQPALPWLRANSSRVRASNSAWVG
jgi:hypothetical protein